MDLAWKISGLPAARIFGMGGVLDSARFRYAVAEATGAPLERVHAIAIGAHGDAMVPIRSWATVDGKPLAEVLPADQVDALVARTVNGGAEVVALLKTGSAFYAPAASVVEMVEAVLADSGRVLPTCARLEGEYGISGVHMSVPARLGAAGVVEVVEMPLADDELAALRASAATIADGVAELEKTGA